MWRAFRAAWQEFDIGPGQGSRASLGRNLTLGQDREVSSGRNLILGKNKEVSFRQECDFGLGPGSSLRYLGHPDTPLETVITGLCLLSACSLNLELTLLLACNQNVIKAD